MASTGVPIWLRARADRYVPLVLVGAGSFGEVSMCIDLLTNTRVAVKKQDTEGSAREFAALSAIGAHPHPHIATMLDYYLVSKGSLVRRYDLYIVYELADSTLWALFRTEEVRMKHLAEDRLARYMYGVARGLSHMHGLGMIHGDASLKNMLLCRQDVVKVADMGAAHSAHGFFLAKDDEMTTLYVRSPERLLGDGASRPAIDVWAFGVQLWCLRSGGCEWTGDAPLATTLANIAAAIGPITCESWPHHTDLPLWATVGPKIVSPPHVSGLSGWSLAAKSLLRMTMAWGPESRAGWPAVLGSVMLAGGDGTWTPRSANLSSSGSCDASTPVRYAALAAGPQGTPVVAAVARVVAAAVGPQDALAAVDALAADALAADALAAAELERTGSQAGSQDALVAVDALPACCCKGNCGSRLHKARANQWYRYRSLADGSGSRDNVAALPGSRDGVATKICGAVAMPGHSRCRRCKCEFAACKQGRYGGVKGAFRWCSDHVQKLRANQYGVPTGVKTLDQSWPQEIKLLARMSHMFEFVEPGDAIELGAVVRQHSIVRPGKVDPIRLAWFFIAHMIKWPAAVRQWSKMLSSKTTEAATVAGMVTMLHVLIEWCDGHGWPEMFRRMHGSSSLMDAQTGLAVHACRLGLARRVENEMQSDEPVKKRQREKTKPGDALGAEPKRYVRLGRGLAKHEVLQDDSGAQEIFQYFVDAVSELEWPSVPVEVPVFADALLVAVRQTRGRQAENGAFMKGGQCEKNTYNAKHFVRYVLIEVERGMPGCLDNLAFERLADWCPDENTHASAIQGRTVGEVRQLFGCNPLLWHCYACLIGFADSKMLGAAVKADHTTFWEPFLEFEATECSGDEPVFAPGPHILMEVFSSVKRP
jgi:hypothetical protein